MAMLDNVSPEEFPPNAVPEVRFDRLNEHYREVVALSRLVLRHGSFESRRGQVRASGFLMDMNVVFQEFVTVALREALRRLRPRVPRKRPWAVSTSTSTGPCASQARPHVVGSAVSAVRGRREVQARHRRVGSERRPVPAPGVRHRAGPAGRAAGLCEGRGGHGGRTAFGTPASGWRSRRSTCPAHWTRCSTA